MARLGGLHRWLLASLGPVVCLVLLVLIWRVQLPGLWEQSGEGIQRAAKVVAGTIDDHVEHMARDVMLIVASPQMRAAVNEASGTGYDAADVARLDSVWIQEWIREGQVPGELEAVNPFVKPASLRLEAIADEHNDLRELILADTFGRLVAGSGLTTDYNQAGEYWFDEWTEERLSHCQHGELCASFEGLDWDDSIQDYTFSISGPMFYGDQEDGTLAERFIGVYKAELDPSVLARYLDVAESTDSVEAYVVNGRNEVILEGNADNASPLGRGLSYQFEEELGKRLCPDHDEDGELCRGHEDHEFHFDYADADGRKLIGVSRSRHSGGGGDWVVVLQRTSFLNREAVGGIWLVFVSAGLVVFVLTPTVLLARSAWAHRRVRRAT